MKIILVLIYVLNRIWVPGALLAVPFGLLAWAIKKVRGYFGLYTYTHSFILGLATWLLSIVFVVKLWGYFWLFVGLLLAGVGVVPMALFALLFHADWTNLLELVLQLALLFGLRVVGAAVVGQHKRRMEYERSTTSLVNTRILDARTQERL